MVDAVSRNAQCQRANSRDSCIASTTVSHDSGHGFDISPPAPILLAPYDDWNRFYCDSLHESLPVIINPGWGNTAAWRDYTRDICAFWWWKTKAGLPTFSRAG